VERDLDPSRSEIICFSGSGSKIKQGFGSGTRIIVKKIICPSTSYLCTIKIIIFLLNYLILIFFWLKMSFSNSIGIPRDMKKVKLSFKNACLKNIPVTKFNVK
jgi:hypothetical protein